MDILSGGDGKRLW